MTRDINLLPGDGRRGLPGRRRIGVWIVAGIAYLALLFAIGVMWDSKIDDAEADLVAQQQIADDLRRQIGELAPLSQLQVDYEAGRAVLGRVLAGDVAWGRVLNDLSRMIPDRLWLTSFNGAVGDDPAGPLGEIQFSGVAFDYPDVGSWLRSLDSLAFPEVDGTWVTGAGRAALGGTTVVEFSSTAMLTQRSMSSRVDVLMPELP